MIWTLTINPALDLAFTTPRLKIRRKLRCKDVHFTPGGGGINCSRVIVGLGGQSRALFTCGGEVGEIVERRLREEGIETERVYISGATRINVLANPEDEEGEYRLLLPGPTLREREWREVLDRLEQILVQGDTLIASGSLPPAVPDDFYARVAAIARRSGARLYLDAPAAALRHVLDEESLFAIKPNRAEWKAICNCGDSRRELTAAAQAVVRESRVQVVLLSLGSEGALCVTGDGHRFIGAPKVGVLGTTGAGDSMLGAFALAVADGQPPLEAARIAVAAGSATATEFGGGLCSRDRLDEMLRKMRAEPAS